MIRIGHGFDVHAFTGGRPLIIGGLTIPHEKGLAGHSDADVLLHTIADAILGALALGDIGKFFPEISHIKMTVFPGTAHQKCKHTPIEHREKIILLQRNAVSHDLSQTFRIQKQNS